MAIWSRIYCPVLKTLHTHSSVLRIICSPELEELHLYYCDEEETRDSAKIPLITGRNNNDPTLPGLRLWRLKILVLYPRTVPRLTPLVNPRVEPWFPHMESVETMGLPNIWHPAPYIDHFSRVLCGNPRLFPSLAKVRSPNYPTSWSWLRDCIEVRNHLAMRDGRIHTLKTIEFPCQVHDNIAEPLQAVLSGRFGGRFRPIPDQPFAISELIPEGTKPEYPLDRCAHCISSGDVFSCLGMADRRERSVCQRYWQDTWAAITGTTSELSGYLQ